MSWSIMFAVLSMLGALLFFRGASSKPKPTQSITDAAIWETTIYPVICHFEVGWTASTGLSEKAEKELKHYLDLLKTYRHNMNSPLMFLYLGYVAALLSDGGSADARTREKLADAIARYSKHYNIPIGKSYTGEDLK